MLRAMPRGMVLVAADPAEDWKIDAATCRRPTQVFCLLVVLTHAIKSARHAIEARPPNERPRGPKIDRGKHLGAGSLTHRFCDRGRRSPSDQHPPRSIARHCLATRPSSCTTNSRANRPASSTMTVRTPFPRPWRAARQSPQRPSLGSQPSYDLPAARLPRLARGPCSRHACRRERACRVITARFHR